MLDTNKIYHGDCLKLFARLPDESVDMVFADPPFNLSKKYSGGFIDRMGDEEYLTWCQGWLSEMVRVVKPHGSIFVHHMPFWLIQLAMYLNDLAYFKHWISWDALPSPMGKSLQPAHYGILYFGKMPKPKFYEIRHPNKRCRKCHRLLKDYGGKKGDIPSFGPLVSDCWSDIHRVKHNKYRDEHPCQLPIHLLERLVLMSTDEGDIVLDPFIGTGTTALAAKRLGRRYIGFESSKEYVECAETKLSQENMLTKIGNSWVSMFAGQRGKNKIVTIRDTDWADLKNYFVLPDTPNEVDYTEIYQRR